MHACVAIRFTSESLDRILYGHPVVVGGHWNFVGQASWHDVAIAVHPFELQIAALHLAWLDCSTSTGAVKHVEV